MSYFVATALLDRMVPSVRFGTSSGCYPPEQCPRIRYIERGGLIRLN